MNILELDSYNLADAVKFNNHLNPKIWGRDEKMLPEVRDRLLEIAADFSEFLGINDLQLKDITVSGSNAAYTYTPHSDVDLHLVVDLPEADKSEVYRELFDAKKYQYNDMHNIKIGGYDVELYVQNANQRHHSQGIYSVLNDDWIDIPKRRKPDVNDISTRSKYDDLAQRIDVAVKSGDFATMDALTGKIREMRQSGLDAHGEFGPENLAFKMLRSQGKIKQLYDARNAAKDRALSLKERKKPGSVFTYGFKHESKLDEVGLTPDGVSPETCMFLDDEQSDPADEEILKDFIEFCSKELKLNALPTIKLRKDPQWAVVHKTFGRYINDKDLLEVAWGQRHIMDVLRTVAHELTHRRQHEREDVPASAGETGSEYENEANARAGILMRDYARLHPEFFEVGQAADLHIDESASGYIPTKKQAKDPRYVMALTKDVRPGAVGKEANKLKLKTNSQGQPQLANPNGLFEQLKLQLEAFKQAKEDYSPDAPPGPESKPTMPKGTVRVDVSDVYDWYKLGQHISNMKGLGQHDFGKGPPSSIISFGDEDTEHEFIDDLKATGLDVTDIDPVDPEKRPGKKIKTDPTYNVNESEELDEVRMSPTALKKFADSPAAKGILVGFEAEMIVPDVRTEEESDMEPDYDADERCRSIAQVIEFFEYDEYGYGISGREAEKLQEQLDEAYYEWQDEQMMRDFQEEAEDLIKKVMIDEKDWVQEDEVRKQLDMMDIKDADQEAVLAAGSRAPTFNTTQEQQAYMAENPEYEKYVEALEEAEDLLDELVQDSVRAQDKYWDAAIDDFRDDYYVSDDSEFFSDVGLRYMTDVANRFDIYWPYMTFPEGEGSQDIDAVADSLSEYIGMPVKASYSYHGATRKPGEFIVEPDSSLEADSYEDGGLEIISPPMPIEQAMEKLNQVIEWAQKKGCYTNSSTGLHMGVSLPGQRSFAEAEGDEIALDTAEEKPIDFMKLALFLGDQYVLKEFGRSANSYCRSSLQKMKEKKWSPQQIATAMEKMRGNLINLAYKDLADRSPGRDSINMKDNYVEFRGAGGDYLSRESDQGMDFLENTLLRYVQALAIAGDPNAYRDEYAKKLYKLISPEGDDTLNLFSKFATGEIDKEKLKTEWARKTLEKDEPSAVAKGNWVVVDNNTGKTVPGQEYSGYTEEEVIERAKEKLGPGGFNQKYSVHPKETGRWEIYRDDHGQDETLEIIDADRRGEAVNKAAEIYTGVIPFKVRAYYGDEAAKPEPSRRAKLAKQIIQKPAARASEQARTPDGVPVWEIYQVDNGHAVHTMVDQTEREAKAQAQIWLQHIGAEDSSLFAVRPKLARPATAVKDVEPDVAQNFTAQQGEQEVDGTGEPIWEIYEVMSDRVVQAFTAENQREAAEHLQGYISDLDNDNRRELYAVRPKMVEQSAQSTPPDATEQTGTWQIVDVTLNQPVETFQGTWAQAERIANQYETGPGEHNGHELSVRRA